MGVAVGVGVWVLVAGGVGVGVAVGVGVWVLVAGGVGVEVAVGVGVAVGVAVAVGVGVGVGVAVALSGFTMFIQAADVCVLFDGVWSTKPSGPVIVMVLTTYSRRVLGWRPKSQPTLP